MGISLSSTIMQLRVDLYLANIVGHAVVGAVICAVIAPIAAPPALGLLGFGAAGPVAGTYYYVLETLSSILISILLGGIAAGWQAGMGGTIATGGWFAGAQSVAMGGVLPAAGLGTAAIVGAVSTAAWKYLQG